MKTIEEIILYCREQFNNEELTDDVRESYYTVGVSLVELLAYRKMYKEDIQRFNQRYEEIDKVIEELEEKEGEQND